MYQPISNNGHRYRLSNFVLLQVYANSDSYTYKYTDLTVKRAKAKLTVPAEELRDLVIEAIRNKKGEDITVIDLRGLEEAVCDFFVICHTLTDVQVRGIANGVIDEVEEKTGEKPFRKEGFQNLEWVLIDYVDVVVHVFKRDKRAFYNLEDLWADGEITEYGTN